jgi:prophage regulatory protein
MKTQVNNQAPDISNEIPQVRCLGGVSRQRTYQITGRPDFPKPLAELKQGRVWPADEVDAWIRAHRHPLGQDLDG